MNHIEDNAAACIYLNGEIRDCRDFQSAANGDFSFDMPFAGQIIYEVVRFIDAKGVFLKDHYQRFIGSLALAGMTSDLSYESYREACCRLLETNGIRNNNLKLMYALREGDGLPLCLIYASRSFYPDETYYCNGVDTAVLEIERPNPNAKISRADYLFKVQNCRKENGVFEVLLQNSRGELTEGSRSNLFFINGGKVLTAPSDMVLEGIMRKYVFEICHKLGISVDDSRAVRFSEAAAMDAAFLTGTSINVLPVARIGNSACYDTENPVLQQLVREFQERIAEEWKKN